MLGSSAFFGPPGSEAEPRCANGAASVELFRFLGLRVLLPTCPQNVGLRILQAVTKEVETIGEVARTPGIYAMYGGERVGQGWVAYVGIAGNLHRRLEQHVIRRDSSVVTGTQAVCVHIEHVRYIDWWTSDLFEDDDARHAAELVAFDVLNPALRSRGRPRQNARTLADDGAFQAKICDLLNEQPHGRLVLPTLTGMAERLRAVEARLDALDQRDS